MMGQSVRQYVQYIGKRSNSVGAHSAPLGLLEKLQIFGELSTRPIFFAARCVTKVKLDMHLIKLASSLLARLLTSYLSSFKSFYISQARIKRSSYTIKELHVLFRV